MTNTGYPTVIGISILNTIILALTNVVTLIGQSGGHNTLPNLKSYSSVNEGLNITYVILM